jgi:uncharacterized protein (DUF4415 family)
MSRKQKLILPTPEEDAAIDAAVAGDPDTYELNDQEFAQLRPMRGRPKSTNPKILLSVRYSQNVVEYFKSTGEGWQARMDQVLREYVEQQRAE